MIPRESFRIAVTELIAQWREKASNLRECIKDGGVTDPKVINRLQLIAGAHEADADDLEAVLAEGVPPTKPGVPGSETDCGHRKSQ
jgi:hypothetical protein